MHKTYLYLSILFSLLTSLKSSAQTIPAARTVHWAGAGFEGNQIDPSTIINFRTSGGSTATNASNDSVFTAISNSIPVGDSAIIYFPNGDYTFNQSLNLRSNIFLVGQSTDSTVLTFNLGGTGDLINISGSALNDTARITASLSKGSDSLTFSGNSLFNVGDFIQIIDNDAAKVTSTWSAGKSGQIVKIVAINGNIMQIDKELRRYYLLGDQPYVRKLNMTSNNKVESLTIFRQDSTAGQTSNINLNYAYNTKLKCVKSINCNFSHVEVNHSRNIEIEGSYFQDSYGYGAGGRAYGVVLQFTTGDCFVYNNNFNHLRHSMLLQAGSNGNVLAYNHSVQPFWTGTLLPSDAAGDLVLHGNYVYANLFEGNSVENLVIDNSHGINGPYNTFFRNRVRSYGIVMNSPQATDTTNFVGNEITNTGFFRGSYLLAGNGHFQHGNNVRGTITPNGTTTLPDSSYYFSSYPAYYSTNSSWPPFGTPHANNLNNSEMETKYSQGILTLCSSPFVSSINNSKAEMEELSIFPNPFENSFRIKSSDKYSDIWIYDVTGKLIYQSNKVEAQIDLTSIKEGVYIIKLLSVKGEFLSRKIIKR